MNIEEQKARIQALADRWLKPLGLLWWRRIELVYYDDRSHFTKNGPEAAMITLPDWRYLDAVIEVNLHAIAEADDKTLEYYFVHEMVHLLIDELEPSREREGNIERAVTQIARAFIWVAESPRPAQSEAHT